MVLAPKRAWLFFFSLILSVSGILIFQLLSEMPLIGKSIVNIDQRTLLMNQRNNMIHIFWQVQAKMNRAMGAFVMVI